MKTSTICTISDNGIGIPKEDLDKIMNPFFRSNPTLNPEIKGYGLGLSTVKKLSRLLDVQFDIQSEINTRTSVTLSFKKM